MISWKKKTILQYLLLFLEIGLQSHSGDFLMQIPTLYYVPTKFYLIRQLIADLKSYVNIVTQCYRTERKLLEDWIANVNRWIFKTSNSKMCCFKKYFFNFINIRYVKMYLVETHKTRRTITAYHISYLKQTNILFPNRTIPCITY